MAKLTKKKMRKQNKEFREEIARLDNAIVGLAENYADHLKHHHGYSEGTGAPLALISNNGVS